MIFFQDFTQSQQLQQWKPPFVTLVGGGLQKEEYLNYAAHVKHNGVFI